MKANMNIAIGIMDFAKYYDLLKYFILGAASLSILIALFALIKPQKVRFAYVFIPTLFAFRFLEIFEKLREFIRKPYVIGNYQLYMSHLLKVEDYPYH